MTVELKAYDVNTNSSIHALKAKVYRRTVNSLGQTGYAPSCGFDTDGIAGIRIENLAGDGEIYVTAEGYHGSRVHLGNFKRISAYSDARKHFDVDLDDVGALNIPMLPKN